MEVEHIFVGGWFQRTTLHLSEFYDFLIDGESPLELDQKKLKALKKDLELVSVEMMIDHLQYALATTKQGITFRVYEDGLIVLGHDHDDTKTVKSGIKMLTDYYEKKLSPAFGYLFSLGAPVPKELANIKTVYPYFVVTKNASNKECLNLLEEFKQGKYFEVKNDAYDIYRGNKLYLINSKSEPLENISRLVEEQIFIREFKGQMHRYLNLHRIIWERIADVKERGSIKGSEIGELKDKIEGYLKTINLIDARINQMGSYISTRGHIVKGDPRMKDFMNVLEYSYDTLSDTLNYVKEIWKMTKNYVISAGDLFGDLQAEATQKSVENLTVVTSMGVGATLIGLFTTDALPSFTVFGVGYFFILALIGWGSSKAISWFYERKNYTVSYEDYDKDIK